MPPTTVPPSDPSCPFCAIATSSPPSSCPLPQTLHPPRDPTAPPAELLLSTPHLIAFLDHLPLTPGHTLLCIRSHREKLSELTVEEGAAVGAWLPVLSRAVVGGVRAVLARQRRGGRGWVVDAAERKGEVVWVEEPKEKKKDEELLEQQTDEEGEGDVGDWNIVQNNGLAAAQVVPHVHFHIIPRLAGVRGLPEERMRSWTVFGRGGREELEQGFGEEVGEEVRRRVGRAVERVRAREGEEGVRALGLGEIGRAGEGGSKL